MPNANKLRNHIGMVRDDTCFFFREEEVPREAGLRRETGLRRATVSVLAGICVWYKIQARITQISRIIFYSFSVKSVKSVPKKSISGS